MFIWLGGGSAMVVAWHTGGRGVLYAQSDVGV